MRRGDICLNFLSADLDSIMAFIINKKKSQNESLKQTKKVFASKKNNLFTKFQLHLMCSKTRKRNRQIVPRKPCLFSHNLFN